MELQEEMTPADAVLLMSSVPERISDLVFGLDETRLRYRHGPAFPTLGGLISHLLDSGSNQDGIPTDSCVEKDKGTGICAQGEGSETEPRSANRWQRARGYYG